MADFQQTWKYIPINPNPQLANPQPATRNPQPPTRNSPTHNPQPTTPNSQLATRNPATHNPQLATRNSQLANPQPSIAQNANTIPSLYFLPKHFLTNIISYFCGLQI
jgi:hypothetical protein